MSGRSAIAMAIVGAAIAVGVAVCLAPRAALTPAPKPGVVVESPMATESVVYAPIQPPVDQVPAVRVPDRLDESAIAELRAGVGRQAKAMRADKWLEAPHLGDSVSPLFEEPVPTAEMLPADTAKSEKTEAGTDRRPTATHSAKDVDKAAGAGAKLAFNPYPQGPEPTAPTLPAGHHDSVPVLAPGRLDWTFLSSRRSLDRGPTALMGEYQSTDQSYGLYVPEGYDPRKFYPLIIHVSPGSGADAQGIWGSICERHGVFLVGPHGAGNEVDMSKRVRIVLDVLDDVRRRFHIDPDRTYISGTSGGGNAASRIAFALPELFGGHIPMVGTWNLRLEPMVRRRVRERLSVALVTGTGDFNGPEIRDEFYPVLAAHHARARLWVYKGMGHAVPSADRLEEVFQWLEAGLAERRALGRLFPASRLVEPLSPQAWSTALVMEASKRLQLPAGTSSGLFMLQEVAQRWKGLPAATIAENALTEFDKQGPAPWARIYQAELLRFRYLQAQTFDGTLNRPVPPSYPVPRSNLVDIGESLWQEVLDLAPAGSSAEAEARKRLTALRQESRRQK